MDNESTLSFWNVFFDNIYHYPKYPNYKDEKDIIEFFIKYGDRSTFPGIQSAYKQCIENQKINPKNNDTLLKWGIDIYNSVLEQLRCKEKSDLYGKIFCVHKEYNNSYFVPVDYKMAIEWFKNGNTGVPRIKSCKSMENINDYHCIRNIKMYYRKDRQERYIKFSIFFGIGIVVGIIVYKLYAKMKSKILQPL